MLSVLRVSLANLYTSYKTKCVCNRAVVQLLQRVPGQNLNKKLDTPPSHTEIPNVLLNQPVRALDIAGIPLNLQEGTSLERLGCNESEL